MHETAITPQLSGPALQAIDDFWRSASRSGWQGIARGDIRRAARILADDAHARALFPEQMLVLVKESWTRLPAGDEAAERLRAQALLEQVISSCINQFFSASPTPDSPTAP